MNEELLMHDALRICSSCGGELEYKGLGEFACKDCGNVEYNDYGKVRNFLEEHPGASQEEVARGTGVTKARVRGLLLEGKIQIAPNSKTFLTCLNCGVRILSGRYCDACQTEINASKTPLVRSGVKIKGYAAKPAKADSGARRFERDK